MKTRLMLGFSLVMLVFSGSAAAAAEPAAPTPKRELAVVVVDSLQREPQGFNAFERIAGHFGAVFEKRPWPVKVTFERFAANNRPHDLELEIFYKGVRQEFDQQVFRAWVILTDRGVKHDFGIVAYRYSPRPAMPVEDMLEAVFRGAGEATASLIGPYVAGKAPTP